MDKKDKIALERYLAKLDRIQEANHVNPNETQSDKKARIEKAKKDYGFMVEYYFPHYASSKCAAFHIKAAKLAMKYRFMRGVMEWARALAKSTHFTILIPFWLWMNDELKVMLLVGKSEEDAKTLLSDLQAEFESNPQIIADFGEQVTHGNWQDGNFVTKNHCAFYSLGRGQSPRGLRYRQHRPDYIVCDDIDDDILVNNPKRVRKTTEWVLSALIGCMDNERARFILVNNRIGTDTILTNMLKRPGMIHMKVNAIDKDGNPSWPEKYTRKYYDELRQFIGHFAFEKEYMNNPLIEGKIFKVEQIQWIKMPRINSYEALIGHWDVAYAGTPTADFNAVKLWGLKDSKFYHEKAFVKQTKMRDPIEWMFYMDSQMPEGVTITWQYESQFWNDALKMTLESVEADKKRTLNIRRTERPVKNKFDRIVSMQPHYQNGRCFHNIDEEGNVDMQTGLTQLYGIEPGYNTHDDGPDADEGCISKLSRFISSNNPLPYLGEREKQGGAW